MAAAALTRVATVEVEIKKHPDMKKEHLEIFKEWVNKQPHFPKIDDDIILLQFLRRCRYSIEKAKVKLDNFLTFRTHFPELCIGRTVDHPDIKAMLASWQHVILPKRDAKGNVVIIIRPLTSDTTSFNPATILKILTTLVECYVRENGTIPGYVIIFDSKNIVLGHMAKVTLTLIRQYIFFIQKCACVSVKGVYNVNSHSFAETALNFIKSVSTSNMVSRIEVFPEGMIDGLYQHVPKEILPVEYGGESSSMDELHREAHEAIKRVSSFTVLTDKLLVEERRRPGASANLGGLLGVQGSFKKLDVD